MTHRMNDHLVPKKMLNQTVFILLASVVLALLVNSLRPGGIRFFQSPGRTPDDSSAPAGGSEGLREISLDAALAAHGAKDVLFADARPQPDYESGHITGALHLPVDQFETWIDGFIETADPSTTIITYCDGPHCPLGKALAEQLYFAGYDNVRHLHNGWSRWKKAGGPDAYGP